MENLPAYVAPVFVATTLFTIGFFYLAVRRSALALGIILAWTALQGVVASTGFYTVTNTLPPRFGLLILPPLLLIIAFAVSEKGKKYLDSLDASWLTYLHVVRIPVEMVLLWLAIGKQVPMLMTFEGRNFDILSGITAPIIGYLGYTKPVLGKKLLIVWNFICLALLANIVGSAILSAPTPLQQLAFDQPNVAVFYFPYAWLPGLIVPLVLLAHVVSLRQLLYK